MKRVSKLRASVRKAVGRSSLARKESSGSAKSGPADALSDDALAVFRGVSLRALAALQSGIESGAAAPGVQLLESARTSKKRSLKRGQTLVLVRNEDDDEDDSGGAEEATRVLCRRAVHASDGAGEEELALALGKDARRRERADWTLEDVCQFVVLPITQPMRGGVYATEAMRHDTDLGAPFEGAFVTAPRATRLKELVTALQLKFADADPAEVFVWLDVLCANQVRARADADRADDDDDDEHATTAELLRRVRLAAAKFETQLVYVGDWKDPRPLRRTWCVWEMLAAAPRDFGAALGSSGDDAMSVGSRRTLPAMASKSLAAKSLASKSRLRKNGSNSSGALLPSKLVESDDEDDDDEEESSASAVDENDDDDDADTCEDAASKESDGVASWAPEPLFSAGADEEFASALLDDVKGVMASAAAAFTVGASRCRDARDRAAIVRALAAAFDTTPAGVGPANTMIQLGADTETPAADAALAALAKLWLARSVHAAVALRRRELRADDAIAWFGALLHNAGQALEALGDSEGALTMLTEALEVCRRELGNRNARVARILRAVALCYQNAGQHAEALSFAEQALPVFVRKFGNDHSETADALNLVANAIAASDRVDDDSGSEAGQGESAAKRASGFYEQAIDIYRRQCGEDSPKVAMALNNAAHAFLREGDYRTAVSYCEEALAIRQARLGDAHPKLASTFCNLGEIYRLQDKHGEAMQRYDAALAIYWQQLSSSHPAAAPQLAAVLAALSGGGDFRSALDKFERAANSLCGSGADASDASAPPEGASAARASVAQSAKAQAARQQRRRRSGGNGAQGGAFRGVNPDVVRILSQKARVALAADGDHERSLVFLSVALALARQVHGEAAPEVAGIMEEMAALFEEMGRPEQSLQLAQSAEKIRRGSGSLRPHSKQGQSVVEQSSRQHILLDAAPPNYI